jgi:hypothetical protein
MSNLEAGRGNRPQIVRWPIWRWREDISSCELWGELVKETEHFWVYRNSSGKIKRTAKSYLANIDQGLGYTGFGRCRGDAREASPVHFEPCPHCPDFKPAGTAPP